METGFLLPDLDDPDSAPFWAGTARRELLIQACADCAKMRMPPRPMCYECHSLRHEWKRVSGRGTIWSFVVAHPPLLPAYAELAPYNVITVSLREDSRIRLVGNLVASPDGPINGVDPSTIEIGMPVRVVFRDVNGVTFPRWMRA
jgi:hypothetical protein